MLGKRVAEDQIHIEIDRETFDQQQEEINAQKRQNQMKMQAVQQA